MKQRSADRVTRQELTAEEAVARLGDGTRLDQPTFHALYSQTPEGFRAELIGGIVSVMASPVSPRHARLHIRLGHWLCIYSGATPGTEAFDNVTSILGAESELQPDVCLLIQPEFGGRAKVTDGAVLGPAELIVEVAHSTRAIDLGRKKKDYEKAGVQEYLVVRVKDEMGIWFRLGTKGYSPLPADADGVFRSAAFPGLWLDPASLFAPALDRLHTVSRDGLASPEHAAFVAALAARKQPPAKKPRKKK